MVKSVKPYGFRRTEKRCAPRRRTTATDRRTTSDRDHILHMHMHMHMHMCMHVRIHACIYVHVHVHVHMCTVQIL